MFGKTDFFIHGTIDKNHYLFILNFIRQKYPELHVCPQGLYNLKDKFCAMNCVRNISFVGSSRIPQKLGLFGVPPNQINKYFSLSRYYGCVCNGYVVDFYKPDKNYFLRYYFSLEV